MRRPLDLLSGKADQPSRRIERANPVATFKHRLRDKVLEVIVFKGESEDLQRAAQPEISAASTCTARVTFEHGRASR